MTITDRHNRHTAGYVFPLVLVFIFVFSAILSIAALNARKAQTISLGLQAEHEAMRRIASAEATAVFHLLTAQPVRGGLDLGPASSDGQSAFGDIPQLSSPDNLWAGSGGVRLHEAGVRVAYRDVGGLISFNDSSNAELAAFLEGLGLSRLEAARMTATLRDYTDADDRRQFMGAEHPDYRLLGRPAPSNSPLRVLSEIFNVLEWREGLAKGLDGPLHQYATTGIRTYGLVEAFMPERVRAILDRDDTLESILESGDLFQTRDPLPSHRARLILSVPIDAPQRTLLYERIIEVTRRANAADRPFDIETLSVKRRAPDDIQSTDTLQSF